jgi:hypothetical protein
MHHATIADRGQNRRESQVVAHHACAEIAFVEGHGISRAEEDVAKRAWIFPKCQFVFSAAIEIVEDGTRQAAPGQTAKVLNVDDSWWAQGGSYGSHGGYSMKKVVAEAMRNFGGNAGADEV